MVKFMEKYIKEGKCRVGGRVEILRNAFAEICVVDKKFSMSGPNST